VIRNYYISYIKHIIYIILFLISFHGVAQEFADKEYYLLDSLMLDEMSKGDRKLLDSCLNLFHTTKQDTDQINALYGICNHMMHDAWKKYQVIQYDLINIALVKHKANPKKIISLNNRLAEALSNYGYMHHSNGNIGEAIESYQNSLSIHTETKSKIGMASDFLNIGSMHRIQGDMSKALEFSYKSLKIFEELGDVDAVADNLNNIAYIHNRQGDTENALVYYHKSLKVYKSTGNKYAIGYALYNIGATSLLKGDTAIAMDYTRQSLKLCQEIGDLEGVANSLNNIGKIYKSHGDFLKAKDCYSKGLKIRQEIGDKAGVLASFSTIGELEMANGDYAKAEKNLIKSLNLSKEIGYVKHMSANYKLLSELYVKTKRYTKALDMFKFHINMRDSLNNESTQKAAAKQEAKYEYEKQKVLDDAEHDKQLAIEQEEKEKQKILTGATAGGLGLVVVFLIFVFNRLRVTKKQKLVIEDQKQLVEEQKAVVEEAHSELEEKNQEIMDSITYAKRIQSAILPPLKVVKEYLTESFILYKPKDIVAGDFYWMEHKDSKVLFAAADCTGHGVPGAMVSVVCNNALNRSVREHGLTEPGEILTKTREIVIQEFEKSEEEVKDGMDIALCSIEDNQLHYAGAHNPLWIIRNGEIIETKANKQPIGQFDNPEPYTTHSFGLEPGDSIYIFSDGYVDQFGGEKGKKFKSKAFRELLLSIQDKSMEDQKTIIDEAFESWRGDLEQIDDVCIIGVKV
jgi:serine phosphatase RsbU (regulator of sigma subunit)